MMKGLKDLNIPGKKIIYGAVYGLVALPILMIILQISPIWIIWTAIILGDIKLAYILLYIFATKQTKEYKTFLIESCIMILVFNFAAILYTLLR